MSSTLGQGEGGKVVPSTIGMWLPGRSDVQYREVLVTVSDIGQVGGATSLQDWPGCEVSLQS